MDPKMTEAKKMKSYVNTRLGLMGRFHELLSLYRVHSHKTQGRIQTLLTEAAAVEKALEQASGRPTRGAQILEVGAGQQAIHLAYFARENHVVGIDLDILPDRSLGDYLRMWRRNGSMRTLKTVGRRALGIDAALARELKKQLSVDVLPSVAVLAMDASAMSFEDATFDAVYSRAVFEHLPDPRRVLCEIRRVLKPGGAVVILFHLYTCDNGCHDIRIFAGKRDHIPYWAHLRPQYRHLVRENTYLNRLRLAQWKEIFESEMPGSRFQPLNDADEANRVALEKIRAAGELADYGDEELLSITVKVVWAKPAAGAAR
jgi:SAM-dependent methyltransferase